jgi:hypothetical protein
LWKISTLSLLGKQTIKSQNKMKKNVNAISNEEEMLKRVLKRKYS